MGQSCSAPKKVAPSDNSLNVEKETGFKKTDVKKNDVQTLNIKTKNVIEHENTAIPEEEEKKLNVLKAEESYKFASATTPEQEFNTLVALPEREEENKETDFEEFHQIEIQMEKNSSQSILEEVLQSLEAGRFNIPLLEEVNPDVAEVIQNLIEQNSVFTFELRELREFFTIKSSGELNHHLLADIYKTMQDVSKREIQQREEAVKQQPQSIPFACKITENKDLLPIVYTRSLRKMTDEEISGIMGVTGVVLEANNLNHMYYVLVEEEIDFWVPQQAVESLVKVEESANEPEVVKTSPPITNLRQLNTKYMKSHSRARTQSKDEGLSKINKQKPSVNTQSMKKKMNRVRSRSRSPDRHLNAPSKAPQRSRSPRQKRENKLTIAELGKKAHNSARRRPAAPKPPRRSNRRNPEPEPKPTRRVVSLPKKMLNIAEIRKHLPQKLQNDQNKDKKKQPPFPIRPIKQLNIPLDKPEQPKKQPPVGFQSTLPTLNFPKAKLTPAAPTEQPSKPHPATKPVARDVPRTFNNTSKATNNAVPYTYKRMLDQPVALPTTEPQGPNETTAPTTTTQPNSDNGRCFNKKPVAVFQNEGKKEDQKIPAPPAETRHENPKSQVDSPRPKRDRRADIANRMNEIRIRKKPKATTNLKILKQKNSELKEGLHKTHYVPELKKRELLRQEQEEAERQKLAAAPKTFLQKRKKNKKHKAVSVKQIQDKRKEYTNSKAPTRLSKLDNQVSRNTKRMVKESIEALISKPYKITRDADFLTFKCKEASVEFTDLLDMLGEVVTLVDFNDVIHCGKFQKEGALYWVPFSCLLVMD